MIWLLLIGMLPAENPATKAGMIRADQVIVLKNRRTLTLLFQGKILRTYQVSLGATPVGAKEQQGDHKTPEGHYLLDRRNAKSRFYKSILDPAMAPEYPQFADGLRQLTILEAELASSQKHAWVEVH